MSLPSTPGPAGAAADPAGGSTHGAANPVRVLLVDDQSLLRMGFRMILAAEEDIEVVGEASDGETAFAQAAALRPDVILMDVRMPGVNGIDATERIVSELPESRVIILTTFDLDEYAFAALRVGASGFLLKDSPPEELVHAVRVVAAGDALLAPKVTRALIADFAARPVGPPRADNSLTPLTERELDVMRLVARGQSNSEIADELFVAEQTVKTHVSRILGKLGLRDRTQMVISAYESGLVRPQG